LGGANAGNGTREIGGISDWQRGGAWRRGKKINKSWEKPEGEWSLRKVDAKNPSNSRETPMERERCFGKDRGTYKHKKSKKR